MALTTKETRAFSTPCTTIVHIHIFQYYSLVMVHSYMLEKMSKHWSANLNIAKWLLAKTLRRCLPWGPCMGLLDRVLIRKCTVLLLLISPHSKFLPSRSNPGRTDRRCDGRLQICPLFIQNKRLIVGHRLLFTA